jgi:hypothetical protein
MDVTIRGDGVAAYCCAHLLHKAGFHVAVERVDRPRLPVIMLGEQALALIRDVFEQPDILQDASRIVKRVVAWGEAAQPIAVEHSAVVVSEESLLALIRPAGLAESMPHEKPRWTVCAAPPLPAQTAQYSFGTRMAFPLPVTLHDYAEANTCWIESLDDGWLFLIPNAPLSGWLLAVGASPDLLLARSRVVAPEIAEAQPASARFPAHPRIAAPLCGDGWLACGTAAMAFDPICGDGTAHAIREAILAAAVIRALAGGARVDDLLSHYEARLTASFHRHLALCRGFYESGGSAPLWRAELDAINRGIRWCEAALAARPDFGYRLRGFELEAVR